MEFRVLGPLEIAGSDGPVRLGSAKLRSVLALLLIHADEVVAAERLIDDLWEGAPPRSASATLQTYISQLRKQVGAAVVESVSAGYRLSLTDHVLDAVKFERALDEVGASATADPVVVAAHLRDALMLWRGVAFADFSGAHWAAAEAARLEGLRQIAAEDLIECRLALGEHARLVPELERLVAANPLQERPWGQLMISLYRCGRQADALRAYGRLRTLLGEELGIEPSAELARLEQAILFQEPELDGLTSQRNRSVSKVEPSDVPAVASIVPDRLVVGDDAESQRVRQPESRLELRNNLPMQINGFVGRATEIVAVRALINQFRLVTLVGPGGAGKTRLALQVAADFVGDGFRDGIWLVELAALREPEFLAGAVAASIGVREEPDRRPIETLTDALQDKNVLIILDNCEHLVDACAKLSDRILRACPGVRVLATSRQTLGIDGEQLFRVPSMSLPIQEDGSYSVDLAMRAEAVRLFIDRATSHQPGFTLDDTNVDTVISLCRRLDGIPLAIELAAARLRSLSVNDIEERLDNSFRLLTGGSRAALPRQQTLQALVDWSYELLSEPERDLLGRLSVFAAGWTLDAVEEICATGTLEHFDVIELLAALVDKSLVQAEPHDRTVRYRLLETIRQYAADKLDQRDPAQVRTARNAHAQWFLQLAEIAAGHDGDAEQAKWFARLDGEQNNLRAAMLHLLHEDLRADDAVRLSVALRGYWRLRGYYNEGVRALERALDSPGAQEQTPLRAGGLIALGYLYSRLGDHQIARKHLEAGLAIARTCGSTDLVADGLCHLAWVAFRQGNKPEALELAEEDVLLARAMTDRTRLAQALHARGTFCDDTDRPQALDDYAEALALYRKGGNSHEVAALLNNLAVSELEAGDLSGSHCHLDEAIYIASRLDDKSLLPYLQYAIGLVQVLQDNDAAATSSLVEALDNARRTGDQSLTGYAVLGLALCAGASHDDELAARLHGVATSILDDLGESLEPLEIYLRDIEYERLRSSLGEKAFKAEFLAGASLSAEHAFVLAAEMKSHA